MVFYCNVLLCHRHVKHVLPCIVHSHLPISDDVWPDNLPYSSQILLCWSDLPDLGWVLLPHIFEKCPFFSQVLHFLFKAGHGLLLCGLPPHLLHKLPLLLLPVNFSLGFLKVSLKLYPTSSFITNGLLPVEELAKAVRWLFNCKFSVISDRDIVGLVLMPPNSLNLASGSLKPEINLIFTNSSSGLVTVLSFSNSQKHASSLRRARKLSSNSPTPWTTDRNLALSAVYTLLRGNIVLNSFSDRFKRSV